MWKGISTLNMTSGLPLRICPLTMLRFVARQPPKTRPQHRGRVNLIVFSTPLMTTYYLIFVSVGHHSFRIAPFRIVFIAIRKTCPLQLWSKECLIVEFRELHSLCIQLRDRAMSFSSRAVLVLVRRSFSEKRCQPHSL